MCTLVVVVFSPSRIGIEHVGTRIERLDVADIFQSAARREATASFPRVLLLTPCSVELKGIQFESAEASMRYCSQLELQS